MRLTVPNVFGLLIRSRLLPRAELQKLLKDWRSGAGPEADDSAAFLRWMVSEDHITAFQADLIARCRADSFFLGQYKLLDRISHGWLSGAFKAEHPSGQIVAIRPLLSPSKKDPAARAEFRAAAERAMQWQHANIMRLFHVGKAHGQRYIALEWLNGESLDEVLARRGRLAPEEAAGVMFHALHGLQCMHERGAVHGSVAGHSVILARERVEANGRKTSKGVVKLLTPDLAHLLAEPMGTEAGPESKEQAACKPAYVAPERRQNGSKVDIRADIFAMGCILYHALTGEPPVSAAGGYQKPPHPMREIDESIPDGLQQIVNWMMAPDPAQRYPTPERAAQALQVYLAAGTDAPPTGEDTGPSPTYLTWLETTKDAKTDAAKPLPVRPIDQPMTPLPAKAPDEATKPVAKVHRKHLVKATDPSKATAEPNAPGPEEEWDVELVPLPPPLKRAFTFGTMSLSSRDLFMLGIGAASTAIAALIGWLFALAGR